MRTIFKILIACWGISTPLVKAAEEIDIAACRAIGHEFKIAPYLNIAGALHKEGKEKAIQLLRAWADSSKFEDQVIVLCRMLFEPKAQGDFRRPRIGRPSFLGGTGFNDWPLEPITIEDGVPILVVQTYVLAGEPEPSRDYLRYCIDHCDWRAAPYATRTPQELTKVVAQWLSKQKWPRPLQATEVRSFMAQADTDPPK